MRKIICKNTQLTWRHPLCMRYTNTQTCAKNLYHFYLENNSSYSLNSIFFFCIFITVKRFIFRQYYKEFMFNNCNHKILVSIYASLKRSCAFFAWIYLYCIWRKSLTFTFTLLSFSERIRRYIFGTNAHSKLLCTHFDITTFFNGSSF